MRAQGRSLWLKLQARGILYSMHHEKTEGDEFLRRLSMDEDTCAVSDGRMAHIFMKEAAERAQTLKADLETNIRHGQVAGREQLFGPFNPPAGQVLVRRLLKSLSK